MMSVHTESRRLAAILAADMVGYSRLMEIDEAGTLGRHKAIQAELIDPKVKEFGGRVVKTTGDGALIEFSSAVNAVLCAVAVQREMPGREADVPEGRRIAYRIGINLGDIIHDGDDIFGDGVNVASRLEGLAEPGGIRISEAVFNSVKGKLDLGFAALGPKKVKNLAEPIPTYEVLLDPRDAGRIVKPKLQRGPLARNVAAAVAAIALVAVGGHVAWDRFMAADTGEAKLLVLPFRAENPAGRQVAEAATENLIASFSRLKGLATAPHAVSMEYKGIDLEPDELPAELGIRYVLDGSARLDDDQLELSARLRDLRSSGDDVVWEKILDGPPAQWLGLLAELKQDAAGSIKLTLNPTERAILRAEPTENIEAYLAFAEAERFRYSGNFFELQKTLPLYEKAIRLDPGFTSAHVGYAEVNYRIWSESFNTIRYTLDALEETERGITSILAEDLSNPHAIGLQVRIQIEWLNRDQALSAARAAVFPQPDEPWLRYVLGLALLASGKYEEAQSEFATYQSLSPRLNSGGIRDLARQYLMLDDPEKALSLLTSIPEEEANRIDHYQSLAQAHARLGDIETAKTYIKKLLKETLWISLLWQKPWFDIYSDPTIYEKWAAAARAAGFPDSPYDFERGRESDRLLHDDLVDLFSDQFKETHDKGPFGMPYEEVRKADGTILMDYAWMKGITIKGEWAIKGDQFCHRTPAIHVGREECNNVYIDRDKSTDEVKHVANVYSIGVVNSVFKRVGK
jgi:adenylate cyclase